MKHTKKRLLSYLLADIEKWLYREIGKNNTRLYYPLKVCESLKKGKNVIFINDEELLIPDNIFQKRIFFRNNFCENIHDMAYVLKCQLTLSIKTWLMAEIGTDKVCYVKDVIDKTKKGERKVTLNQVIYSVIQDQKRTVNMVDKVLCVPDHIYQEIEIYNMYRT